MGYAAAIVSIISTVASMASSAKQGQQQQQQANYQAAQASADANAERQVAQVNAEKIRRAARKQQSSARSALAASGVMADAGTPLMIQGDIIEGGEQDALTELLTGVRKGQRLDIEASGLRSFGANAVARGYSQGAGTLLAQGGQMASKYGGGQQAPAPVTNRDRIYNG
jgi:hypothetical protein